MRRRVPLVLAAVAAAALVVWHPWSREPAEPPREVPLRAGVGYRVRVFDEGGRAAPGILVEARLFSTGEVPPDPYAFQPIRARALPAEPAASAVTGPDGRCMLEGLLRAGTYELRAVPALPRCGSAQWVDGKWLDGEIGLLVAEGSPLRGRVVDASGRGVAAVLSASLESPTGSFWFPEAETRPDGSFDLPAAPHGTAYFFVTAPAHRSRGGLRAELPVRDGIVLRIEPEESAAVSGRVVDEDGAGIAGADVVVTASGPGAAPRDWLTVQTRTGSDGRFVATGLPVGRIAGVSVRADGLRTRQGLFSGRPIVPGNDPPLEIVLSRGGTVEGRCLDADGRAVGSVEVEAVPWPGGLLRARFALSEGSGGRFRIPNVAAGIVWLRARTPGWRVRGPVYGHQPDHRPSDDRVPLLVTEGGVVSKDLVLEPVPALRGVVLDARGLGVPGVSVTATSESPWGGARSATTDATGAFLLPGFDGATTWRLEARTSTHRSEVLSIAPGDATRGPVEIRLRPASWIAGVVRTADGRPVPDVEVGLSPSGWRRTDRDGAFRFDDLAAGTHSLLAWTSQGGRPEDRVPVTLGWGKGIEDVVLPFPATASIDGLVVDDAGLPVTQGNVQFLHPELGARQGAIRPSGTFRVERLLPGTYAAQIDQTPIAGLYRAGSRDVRLVVPRPPDGIQVTGSVFDPQGVPLGSGRAALRTATSFLFAPISSGRFEGEVKGPADLLEVFVQEPVDARGRAVDAKPVHHVHRDLSQPIEIRLRPAASVSGRVVDPDGAGVGGVFVHAFVSLPTYSDPVRPALTRPDGSFRIVGLPDGRLSIQAFAEARWVDTSPVEVDAGASDVRLTVVRGREVAGRVVDEHGRPSPRASVRAQWDAPDTAGRPRPRAREGTADPDGRFRIVGLGAERVTLTASAATGANAAGPGSTGTAEVTSGTDGVEIVLRRGLRVGGVVLLADGAPAGGARVTMAIQHTSFGGLSAVADDGTGSFSFEASKPATYVLHAASPGGAVRAPETLLQAPAHDVRLVLPRFTTIRGSVEEPEARLQAFLIVPGSGAPRTSDVPIDRDGSFQLELAADVRGTIYVRERGGDRYALADADPSAAQPFRLGLRAGLSIEGRVTAPVKLTTGSLEVRVEAESGVRANAVVASDGTFAVGALPPGAYTVFARGRASSRRYEFHAGTARAEAGARGVTVELQLQR